MTFKNSAGLRFLSWTPITVKLLVIAMASLFVIAVHAPAARAFENPGLQQPSPFGYNYAACANGDQFIITFRCVAWTSGWPNGRVRAETAYSGYYAIKIQGCSDGGTHNLSKCSAWADKGTKVLNGNPGYSPSVTVSKSGWYRTCTMKTSVVSWYCSGAYASSEQIIGEWPLYLGD